MSVEFTDEEIVIFIQDRIPLDAEISTMYGFNTVISKIEKDYFFKKKLYGIDITNSDSVEYLINKVLESTYLKLMMLFTNTTSERLDAIEHGSMLEARGLIKDALQSVQASLKASSFNNKFTQGCIVKKSLRKGVAHDFKVFNEG